MTNNKKNKTFEVDITLEHLGQSVQQYLTAYGYFKDEGDFFVLESLSESGGNVKLKGRIEKDA